LHQGDQRSSRGCPPPARLQICFGFPTRCIAAVDTRTVVGDDLRHADRSTTLFGKTFMISTHVQKMRSKLRSGQIALGAGITLTDPTITEALAPSVDFVWIDLEHNALTTEAMLGHLIAARA